MTPSLSQPVNNFSSFFPRPNEPSGLPEGLALVGASPSYRKAEEWAFVLRSVGLDGTVRRLPDGRFGLLVLEVSREKAFATIRDYEAENRDWPPAKPKDRALYQPSYWAVGISALLLVFFFMVTGPVAQHSRWFQVGTADAAQLLHGKPWQAITALTLHADADHVIRNAVSGAVLLTMVHRRLGVGLGTLTVLASGAVGNALNAVYHGTHRSIGASTAVFAAVGVLAASQALIARKKTENKWSWAGPIAGGLALLGLMGSAAHTDVWAHGFGFLGGLALGAVAILPLRSQEKPLPRWLDVGFGVTAALAVAAAWGGAMLRG